MLVHESDSRPVRESRNGRLSLTWAVLWLFLFLACPYYAKGGDCPADPTWLPTTSKPSFAGPPPPHSVTPSDCPFYQAAWQTYLYVTQPDSAGLPSFLGYPTIEQTFGSNSIKLFALHKSGLLSLAPRTLQTPNGPVKVGAGVKQAGPLQGLLIDQEGNPIYYAIHMNTVFTQFLKDNNLLTRQGALAGRPDIVFPTGTIELKSAWKVVSNSTPPTNYFVTQALVPHLTVKNGEVTEDPTAPPRQVTVALLAIHVVFALEGHPEMIWSTFEHIDGNHLPDTAPSAPDNPAHVVGDPVVSSSTSYALYKANTPYSKGNTIPSAADMANSFDETTQTFTKEGQPLQTSIFRLFPASKSLETDLDDEVASINSHMQALFAKESASPNPDRRQYYQLVGAVWFDNPANFLVGKKFANKPGDDPDKPGTLIAGEDRLSGTAMESFTQSDTPGNLNSSPNCFSCHDTQSVSAPDFTTLIKPKKTNVSHVISRFLLDSK